MSQKDYSNILYSGAQFNKFKIIREMTLEERKLKNINGRIFELECQCGKIVYSSPHRLLKNNVKSCGCQTALDHTTRHEANFQQHIGKKVNMLLILGTAFISEDKTRYIKCLCDCGKIVDIPSSLIINNKKPIVKSCGCLKNKVRTTQPWAVELRKYKKHCANNRNFSFTLSEEEFTKLCQANCYYCDAPPTIQTHVGKLFRNGIDRIDNSIGYEPNNCLPCCTVCNQAKHTMSFDDFMAWIKRLCTFQESKKDTNIPV